MKTDYVKMHSKRNLNILAYEKIYLQEDISFVMSIDKHTSTLYAGYFFTVF